MSVIKVPMISVGSKNSRSVDPLPALLGVKADLIKEDMFCDCLQRKAEIAASVNGLDREIIKIIMKRMETCNAA